MMAKNNINNEDEKMIRQMMQASKKSAHENLKYRIMHQIETEAALSKKHQQVIKPESNFFRNFVTVFGAMYAVIAFLSLGAYFTISKDFLFSAHFIGLIIFVASAFSIFWLITSIDELIREKSKK